MRRFINGLVARMRPEIREITLGTAILNLSIIEMGTGKVASLHAWPYHTLRYELGGGKQLVGNIPSGRHLCDKPVLAEIIEI